MNIVKPNPRKLGITTDGTRLLLLAEIDLRDASGRLFESFR